VTTPEDEPTVAIAVLLLDQTPPDVGSVSAVVAPTQARELPAMADGTGLTVNVAATVQPVLLSVKVTGAVPLATPVTTPVEGPIVATEVFPLTHVPEPARSDKVIVLPRHTGVFPDGATGAAFTVAVALAKQPVGAV
jgi:hypothetical protein